MKHQTVSALIHQIKDLLEGEFRQVSVTGEVSNLSQSASGHYYFTLSDREASISVVLFRGDALRNSLIKKCRDGDQVFCLGSLGVYQKRGTFQLIARQMAPAGQGDLKAQYEALKLKLAGLGLFDPERKRPLPEKLSRVAVITAKGGAALQDFLQIFRRRSYQMDVTLIPTLVQGDQAAPSLVKALRLAIEFTLKNPARGYDVIVLTRGGGSLEDLWAFNDEALAWEIYNCPIPVISAVGHQVDTSLSDLVADIRAETPSAAAELLTKRQEELRGRLEGQGRLLAQRIRLLLREYRHKRENLSPKGLFRLIQGSVEKASRRFERVDFAHRGVQALALQEKWLKLDELIEVASEQVTRQHERSSVRLEARHDKLQVLNPKHVLSRGFTYIADGEGHVVKNKKSFQGLKSGTPLSIHFVDGIGEVQTP